MAHGDKKSRGRDGKNRRLAQSTHHEAFVSLRAVGYLQHHTNKEIRKKNLQGNGETVMCADQGPVYSRNSK